MRKSMSLLLAAFAVLLAPAAAQAKPYYGDGAHRHRSVTGHAHSHKYSRKYAKKSSMGRGQASSSTSCLTSEARALLGRLQSRFGHVQVISTCRPGARIATSGRPSKHASGQAIDFRVPGRKSEVVKWLVANHHSGGTMTYSDMDHIHVDVGYHFVALNRPSGH
ncbi:MAG TPA: D-Ala-D-Ala carboxypeptidase family metallohydrolase [Hyphomicrobium sp.]|nr:D-Ala-D-Ala carboxypeptidase family metallohydrolase [Hyphomicrobium sp.]